MFCNYIFEADGKVGPNDVAHTMIDLMRARVHAIACGYPDANDLDMLRQDPAFKLACGRLPESGDDLTSSRPCRVGRIPRICGR